MAKVLIIEDTSEVAEMIHFVLTAHSHEIEIAYSTQEAFQKIIAFAPDILVLDVWLGSGNGKDLCKEIRKFNKKIPIILMSANAALLHDYEICEANDILEKPFDISVLLDKINKLLIKL